MSHGVEPFVSKRLRAIVTVGGVRSVNIHDLRLTIIHVEPPRTASCVYSNAQE